MKIKLEDLSDKHWITSSHYSSIKSYDKFIKYIFPDTVNVTVDNNDFKYYILNLNGCSNDIIYKDNIIYILVCVENCYAHHYKLYYKYGMFGNKNIKLYFYNHIDKIIQTDEYMAIPIIYNQIDYFNKYYNDIKPNIITSFKDKKFCLFVTNNHFRSYIKNYISSFLQQIDLCDTLNMYKNLLYDKSCYHSIELINIFNQYKFIFVCENSVSNGYITEKIFNCFFSRTIPIYNGCESINDYFDKNCFINANDIDNLHNLKDNIIKLMNNENLYNEVINCNKINKSYNDENYKKKFKEFINVLEKNKDIKAYNDILIIKNKKTVFEKNLEKQKLEKQKLEKQKLEKQNLEKQKLKKQKLEKQKLEKQKLEKQKLEKQKLEKQKLEKIILENKKKRKFKLFNYN